jgi:hypothetical protein
MTNAEAAVRYARNGWPVFPLWPIVDGRCACGNCSKPGKHPRISGWEQHACDLSSVEAWWRQWPDAGIAVRLDNLFVLDLDTHDANNGFESLAALEQENRANLHAVVTAHTGGGGEHQLFQGVEGVHKSIGFRAGLDLLTGPGCFIVAAPTVHATGSAYRWCDEVLNPLTTPRMELALTSLPDWLVLAAAKPKSKGAKTTGKTKVKAADRVPVERIMNVAVDKIKAGAGRNDAGFWLYQQLNDNQYTKDEAFLTLRAWIDAANAAAPGGHKYTTEEAKATWRSAYTKDAREPWSDSEKPSQADEILDLCSDFEFFRSGPADDGFIRLAVGGHHEVHLAATAAQGPTSKLRKILTQRFLKKRNRAPAPEALNAAANTIAAWCDEGQQMETFCRFARSTDAIYLDLANDSWQAVKITADGWQVISNPPVLFRRGGGAEPLPLPVKGGSLNTLRGLMNTGDDDNFCLLLAWLIGCFQPVGAFTVLVVEGEKGSAKTTSSELLIAMVDPSGAPLVGPPKNEEAAVINAMHTGILGYDNLKTLRAEISDILCRFSSGIGYKARTLYETTGITVVKLRLPVLLNGISDCVLQPDLLDRSIKLWLPFIAKAERTTIAAVKAEFEEQHPALLGALLDVVATGLRNLPTTVVADAPRMSDFATWLVSCESGLPFPPGTFLRAYRANQRRASADALELDDVGAALVKYAEQWLTPDAPTAVRLEDLLAGINEVTQRDFKDMRNWPSNAQGLAYRLSKLAGNLRERGIHIKKLKRDGDGARYEIRREGGPRKKLALLPAPADWPSDDDAPVAA